MKTLRRQNFLLTFAFLFYSAFAFAQTPTVTAQAGYPVGRPASQVAYGNSKYVLLTTYMYNQVFQSTTGTSWAPVSATGLTTAQLNFMAYGAGVFVVVGNGGVIQSSTDGITWTTRTSGTSNNLTRIYFVNSKFFAIGKNRTLLTSADGITWSSMIFNAGDPADFFMSLTYGNGVYVLSARKDWGSSAIIYRSTTAANNSWTATTNSLAAGATINRIQYLNNKFFVFTADNSMYNSTDGITWTNFTSSVVLTHPDGTTIPWGLGHQIFNGVWDGTKYSFFGSSQYHSGYGSTFTSTDGVNFTLLSKTAYIVPQESSIINGTYFICGNEGIVSSSDGLTYKHSGTGYRDMVKTASKYVAVGMISSEGQIYNSTDFTTWTSRHPSNIKELYSIAYDGSSVLLSGGYTGVYRSTNDGDSWSNVYTNANETFMAMAYGNGRFVAGGYDGNSCFLRYSTNGGTSWTTANSLNHSYNKIKWVNNRFFALGTDNDNYTGRIMYSTDGINWTNVTPSLGFDVYYFKDVVFDGSKYHFLGVDLNYSFFTVSTATPATAASYGNKAVCTNTPAGVTLGGTWDEGLLEYSNGKFTGAVIDAATGQDYIITSTNGSSWTALPQNTASTITAAYTNGNTLQMIGRANAYFTVTNGNILPVRLLHFNGSLSGSAVALTWSTVTEENTQQFVVQHSTDGSAWSAIGTVKAAGNSTSKQDYQFTHAAPVEGLNFYRLLQQDRNGQSSYSRVVAISNSKAVKATWYPNPVINQLTVRTTSTQPGVITFFNAGGQPVKRARISGYETQVNMTGLAAGVYVADIRQGGQQQRLTIVKN